MKIIFRMVRKATVLLGLAGIVLPAFAATVMLQRPAFADCQQNSPNDGGSASGYTWNSYITAYMSGNCAGSHYVGYDYYSTANATVWIDVDSARVWLCGTPQTPQNPAAQQTTLVYGWSGWAGPTTCGWQADMSTHYWKTGVFDDWTYTNI